MTPQDLMIRMLPPFGGWLALASLALPGGSPLRGAAVAAFLAVGPGAALVRICGPALGARSAEGPVEDTSEDTSEGTDEAGDAAFAHHSDLLERLMLAVLLSVSVAILLATVLIAAHALSGDRVLLTLTLLTTLAAFCPALRARPAPGTAPGAAPPTWKGSTL
ncbi:hypothetical protein [Streptomyces mayonensis]|uniref:hypothetical protein n=1 Tax=Streptomyces mayonensis TaxID=2750816 RepID=UPI001C1E07D4|nr:hypothetical protein [Streptomyces sp. A108]MBU6536129.1 hypothetical protein [Streptomyces sp. A108]